MSLHSLSKLPHDPDTLNLRKDAQTTLSAYRAFLADPAFQHRIDLKVLTSIAANESLSARERRRAAEILGKLYVQVLSKSAELACVREQVLEKLGMDPTAKNVAVTQVNTKIEIVRHDDWRQPAIDVTPDSGAEDGGG